jgi:6-phosphofructokinase 1
VLVPETFTDLDALVKMLNTNYQNKKRASVVVVAEGDDAGDALEVLQQIKPKLLSKDIRVTVLGHIQRGGRPTVMDRVLGSRLGLEAVRALIDGQKGIMIGQVGGDICHTPFEIAIKHHQTINPTLLEMVEILS